jgi:hypothetical protein
LTTTIPGPQVAQGLPSTPSTGPTNQAARLPEHQDMT